MYPSKKDTKLWVAMNFALRAISRDMESALKAEGLPGLRWYDVLWALEGAKDGLRPFELEKKLLFEQSNVSHMLRKILSEGLVEIVAHEDDGRGKVVRITNAGRDVRKEMWRVYGPLIHKHFSKIQGQQDLEAYVDPALLDW